jgi:predicted nucleic acid-binding protein
MMGVLVDSNVILDVYTDDAQWADWSESVLNRYCTSYILYINYINPVIYDEISMGFDRIEDLESALLLRDFKFLHIPKEALFLAGKAFLQYRRRQGNKTSPLPDFFIGAHAAVADLLLMTRDPARMQIYFPTVQLITPTSG